MNHTEDPEAWQKYVEADLVHRGHGGGGNGSPITQIVLEFWAKKMDAVYLNNQNGNSPEGSAVGDPKKE